VVRYVTFGFVSDAVGRLAALTWLWIPEAKGRELR
jgi:hypothetical protein